MNKLPTHLRSPFDKAAVILTGIFVVFLIVFGWEYRPVKGLQALEAIQAGTLPKDAFHPLLYPILAGVVGRILNDVSLGAKLVSNVMAGIFVFGTYVLAARVVNKTVALICVVFMITNLHVIVFGVFVSTDMMGAACMTLVLLVCVRLLSKPNLSTIILLGFAFSLAYFTRYQAMLLLPTVFISIWLSAEASAKTFFRNLAIFFIATAVFLIPHFWLTMRSFGHPLYNENWKNVALKVYFTGAWQDHGTYLANVPFHSLTEVILYSPGAFAKSAIRELVLFARFGVNNLVGLPPLLAGLFFIGCYFKVFSLSKVNIILISFLAIYVIGIALTFKPEHARVMLPILPVCYLIIADFLMSLDSKVQIRRFTIRPVPLLVVLILVAKFFSILPDLRGFIGTEY